MKLTSMCDCPKFNTCSANVCPLDLDWHLRTHIQGERVCFMLNEAVKSDSARVFTLSHRMDLYLQVIAVMPDIQSRWGAIRRALEKAKLTGSRMKAPPQSNSRGLEMNRTDHKNDPGSGIWETAGAKGKEANENFQR